MQIRTDRTTITDPGYGWDGQEIEVVRPENLIDPDFGQIITCRDGDKVRRILIPLVYLDMLGQDAALRLLTDCKPDLVVESMRHTNFAVAIDYQGRRIVLSILYIWEAREDLQVPRGIIRPLWERRIPADWFGLDPASPPVPGGMRPRDLDQCLGTVYGCGNHCLECYEPTDEERAADDVRAAADAILALAMEEPSADTHRQIAALATWVRG